MGLRFSIKWALAAMAYAALAAAALTQSGWAYTDVLWLVTFFAIAYAVLAAIYRRGARQASAIGFVVVSIGLACSLFFAPENLPTERVLTALGVIKEQIIFASPPAPQMASGGYFLAPAVPNAYATGAALPTLSLRGTVTPTLGTTTQPPDDALRKVRAANALATMVAGLIGCVLGALAYRQARSSLVTPSA